MQQQQSIRQILEQAREKFVSGDFSGAKAKLQQISQQDKSIQLNKLLVEFQLASPENCEAVLSKLLNMLTQTDIELYKKNIPNQINFIPHQMLYYNIVAISQYLGKNTLAQMVGSQALCLYKSLQTGTALMLIFQNLRRSINQNRLSTCLQLLQKFIKINQHARNLNNQQERLKIMINILFISTLLKLKLIDQSKSFFMWKFNETDSEKFVFQQKISKTRRKNKLAYKDFMNFLKSQIDFSDKNYQKSISLMSDYLSSQSSKQKLFAENNIAINLCVSGKAIAAHKIFINNSEALFKVLSTQKKYNTQIPQLFQKTKQNIILSYLCARRDTDIYSHYNIESDQKCFNNIKSTEDFFSFKQEYRRGQCCINLYHSLLEKSSRKVPWQQIHDNYDNVYYNPNQPYYQFKGRNKNVFLANKKPVYRRYVLNQWNDDPTEEQIDKDQNRRKSEQHANASKLNQILIKAQEHFRKSLIILQKQQSLVVRIQVPQINLGSVINQQLFHEYKKFKSSLLCLLAYTSLCLCKWHQVINYSEEFTQKKCGQISAQNNYSVLSYQLEAYCQLNKMEQADKLLTNILGCGISKTATFDCRDGSNLANSNVQKDVNQEMNFIYNMTVLHCRNNRIPQAHQSIQKLFTQMNSLQNYPKTELPLSTLELLIYYNLRTQNFYAALQLIKRRRLIPVSASIKPILNITK